MKEHTRRLRLAFRDPAWVERLGWLRRSRFDDGSGLPPAPLAAERAGDAVAWLATLFVALVGTWEIAGPFAAGHYAASTAMAVAGENMLRWHVVAPVPAYTLSPPTAVDFYCHHPFGVFWTSALFSALFGHHDWVCRLPAVLCTTLMPRLIFGACRALYGPIAGGLAALAYVVVPITLAYANYLSLEVTTMFGMALATYGFARFFQTDRARFGVLGVLGMSYAAACDWTGFVFDGLVLAGLFVRGFVLGERFAPLRFEPFARVWAWAVVAV
ncbi:MAG TPA: glycosyltransferase family 39 protein, partial [Polyangiaceae bacterium]|nr:glycosyltransferase family 39 protein [Polyangiaceae bacterium]